MLYLCYKMNTEYHLNIAIISILKNNKSARESADIVSTKIKRLVENRCIMRVEERPFVVSI